MNSNNNSITNNRRIVVTTWGSLTKYDDLGLVTLWIDDDNLTQKTSLEEADRKTTVLHQGQIIDEFATVKTKQQQMNDEMKKKKKLTDAVQHQDSEEMKLAIESLKAVADVTLTPLPSSWKLS